jgi:hypothetical protein
VITLRCTRTAVLSCSGLSCLRCTLVWYPVVRSGKPPQHRPPSFLAYSRWHSFFCAVPTLCPPPGSHAPLSHATSLVHTGAVFGMALSPGDGSILATCSTAGAVLPRPFTVHCSQMRLYCPAAWVVMYCRSVPSKGWEPCWYVQYNRCSAVAAITTPQRTTHCIRRCDPGLAKQGPYAARQV